MKNKKTKEESITFDYFDSFSRMKRWNECQKIGKVYYESQLSFDQLLQVKEFLILQGVAN